MMNERISKQIPHVKCMKKTANVPRDAAQERANRTNRTNRTKKQDSKVKRGQKEV